MRATGGEPNENAGAWRAVRAWIARLGGIFATAKSDRELEMEIESNLGMHIEENLRAGMTPAEARRRALIAFGGVEAAKESYRERRGVPLIETTWRDVRYGVRMLRKSPGFTVVAVVMLALAIGANAVVFSVMNAMLLRPLNLRDAETLWVIERGHDRDATESYLDYVDMRERNRSFEDLAAYTMDDATLDTGHDASSVWAEIVSVNFFDVLGVEPLAGRVFHAQDEHGRDSAPYVVLSYAYWHSHFQDDRDAVGRVVQINKHPFTIVGVAPRDFTGTLMFFHPDVYVPIQNQQQVEGGYTLESRGNHWLFEVEGHLKPGVTTSQAVADLNAIGAEMEKNYPSEDGDMKFALARPGLHGDYLRGPLEGFFGGLTLLAGLILLAACANLGSLFAARAADRSREVALRLALGASRTRVMRQLLTEALLISVMGGALGLWASMALLNVLGAWQPVPRYPVSVPVAPDANAYWVALALTIASGLLFGAVPVRQVLRTDAYQVIKSGALGSVGRRVTVRDVLLVAEVAICALLVTSSLVAVRGLVRSLHAHLGFDPRNTMVADASLSAEGYSAEQIPEMRKRMLAALESIPGVESVGLSDLLPFGGEWPGSLIYGDQTTDLRQANAASEAFMYKVSPEFFQASGTALLEGRAFTWEDDANAPQVAVVNRLFARRVFGGEAKAIGGIFKMPDGKRLKVVGIVEDGKYYTITEVPQAAMFFPILQSPSGVVTLVVRSGREPQQLAAAMRNALRNVDAGLAVEIETRYALMDEKLFAARMATMSLGVLGAMGALLSATGIFGMAAYTVSKRKRELGIRIALGAQRNEVLKAALGRAFKLLGYGSAAGLALGILGTRVLAYLVYQATPRDPVVLTGAVVMMMLIGLLAAWIPAKRALGLDPLVLLRED